MRKREKQQGGIKHFKASKPQMDAAEVELASAVVWIDLRFQPGFRVLR